MLTVESLYRSANSFRSNGDTVSARKREEALAEKKERPDGKQREKVVQVEVKVRSSRMLTVESLSRSADLFRSDGDTVSTTKRASRRSVRKMREITVSGRERAELSNAHGRQPVPKRKFVQKRQWHSLSKKKRGSASRKERATG
jgi:hypothetical protein